MEENEVLKEIESDGVAFASETEPEEQLPAAGNESVDAEPEGEQVSHPMKGLEIEGLREIVDLIREAEMKGYERGRAAEKAEQRLKKLAELERTRDMWHNERLAEAEREAGEKEMLGEGFLTRIKPSVWD